MRKNPGKQIQSSIKKPFEFTARVFSMLLDVRTLLIVFSLTAVVCAGAVLFMHTFRFQVRGTLWWAAGSLISAGGSSLVALRDIVPDFITIVVANFGVYVGFMMLWNGMRLFAMKAGLPRYVWILPVFPTLLAYWWSAVEPSVANRVILISVVLLIVSIGIAHDLIKGAHGQYVAARKFTGFLYISYALFQIVRIILTLQGPQTSSFMTPAVATTAMYLYTQFFAVANTFGVILMISEKLHERVMEQAVQDPLTGVYNMRAFHMFAGAGFARVKRADQPLALMILDLDHFKEVNDLYGHEAGDKMLVRFTATAAACIREQDMLFRYGGEEFIVLMPNTNEKGGAALAERIRSETATAGLMYKDTEITRTVSIGVTQIRKSDKSVSRALRRADRALYHAKQSGRNRVVRSTSMDEQDAAALSEAPAAAS